MAAVARGTAACEDGGVPATAPILLAQLTDMHIVEPGGDDELWVDNAARLREAVATIADESPSVVSVLATGDLTNDGRPGEYAVLAAALAPLSVPVWPLPGNHDDRTLLRETFPGVPWADAEHASWATDMGGVRLIGLDSTIPGAPGAEFDATREEWLRARLADPFDGTKILALHHPPFVTGIEWMDRSGFVGLDRLGSVLAEHPVDRVVCGHMHRPIASTISGIPVQVGISTVQSIALDLSEGSSPAVIRDPSGYLIHRVDGDSIVTHTRYIATRQQPIVPRWADRMS
jgi:3',5'-cyclic AMP phosphodiesterase CpdA